MIGLDILNPNGHIHTHFLLATGAYILVTKVCLHLARPKSDAVSIDAAPSPTLEGSYPGALNAQYVLLAEEQAAPTVRAVSQQTGIAICAGPH